ncbi:NADP-dependent oxidoreductase [Sphingobium sp. CR2-8]|uniref:NADP-dependent oxidoreductase n=1 Tax=Sphingobium sp. CR2-8 TaxID=1306534 RepID=UPI002DBC8D43|nr:NADP-dependent oxidoreductase [Sphingobium sp. CR2-8]MEC3909392.1 NADP-dependent oxidoreductase [Sphingobium sp. CR2-8]
MINMAWILKHRPQGDDWRSAIAYEEFPVSALQDGDVLLRTLYISLDPANRLWMREEASYILPLPLGQPLWGSVLAEVVESRSDALQVGDIVMAQASWAQYSVVQASAAYKVAAIPGLPLSALVSVLGLVGWTAYFGIVEVGAAKPGDVLVVSGAAGAVGSLVGQIGKNLGLHVIGIAGNDEKCRWLTQDLGFDAAINYRTENIAERLAVLAPAKSDLGGGVDLYFENVGGAVGNAVYSQLAHHARVVLCGLISQYNSDFKGDGADLSHILMRSATIKAFIVSDYASRIPEAVQALVEWILAGKLKYELDIIDGLDGLADGFARLFEAGGGHKGKLLVRLDATCA